MRCVGKELLAVSGARKQRGLILVRKAAAEF